MKKLTGFLLLTWLLLLQVACKKSNDVSLNETSAHVLYGNSTAVDGMGYFIHVDGTGENVIPINLPSSYQQPTASTSVAVKFVDTGKRQVVGDAPAGSLGLRVVYIVTLRKL